MNFAKEILYSIKVCILWLRQGRPDPAPVVISEGTVTRCRHGFPLVERWVWDFSFQTKGRIDRLALVDYLTARYGETRVESLDCCEKCRAET